MHSLRCGEDAVVDTNPASPTPITTTALRFTVSLDAEGGGSQLGNSRGARVEAHAGTRHDKLTPP